MTMVQNTDIWLVNTKQLNLIDTLMIYCTITVDWEIFAVKIFLPVASAVKIKHTKISYAYV